MPEISAQIISGVIVAIISFGFGYFLFRSQTNEQIRLEVYRRRLDSYEKIISFLDELDFFAHGWEGKLSKDKKDEFVKRAFQLRASTSAYVPPEIQDLLGLLVDHIDFLPDEEWLEKTDEKITHIIEKDIGKYLVNWRTKFISRDKSGKFRAYFSKEK